MKIKDCRESYITLDIENDSTGKVLDIDICEYLLGGYLHHTFDCWESCFSMIKDCAKENKKYRRVYAHNGGGWDWLSFIEYLSKSENYNKNTFSCCISGSKLIILKVKVNDKVSILFCDSMQVLQGSLKKLTKTFLNENESKIDIDMLPEFLKLENELLYYEYLRRDTESLHKVISEATNIINDKVAGIGTLGVTVGSTAMKVYKELKTFEIEKPLDDKLRTFLRDGYLGGKVNCFKTGHFKNVNVYDINSLYPSVMINSELPFTGRGCWTKEFTKGDIGIYYVEAKQNDTTKLPFFYNNDYYYKGSIYSPELEYFIDNFDCEVTIHNGYKFQDCDILFGDYVNKLYKLRQQNKGTGLDLICKLLLNSLYGKFGQKPENSSLEVFTPEDYEQKLNDIRALRSLGNYDTNLVPFNLEYGLFELLTKKEVWHEHVGIAGMITSYARVKLYQGLTSIPLKNVLYCDTDSVHCTGKLPDDLISETELGKFKLEFSGQGVYAGKKLYALKNNESEKITAKGIRVGGDLGYELNFDLFNSLVNGKILSCQYKTTNTVKQVLQGAKSCVFETRNRKIKEQESWQNLLTM